MKSKFVIDRRVGTYNKYEKLFEICQAIYNLVRSFSQRTKIKSSRNSDSTQRWRASVAFHITHYYCDTTTIRVRIRYKYITAYGQMKEKSNSQRIERLRVCYTYKKYAQIYKYIGLYATNYGRNNGSIFMRFGKMLVESIIQSGNQLRTCNIIYCSCYCRSKSGKIPLLFHRQ